MPNVIDYVRTCTKTFDELPVNRVDALVFSWLANMHIPETAPQSATVEGVEIKDLEGIKGSLALVAPVYDPDSTEALLRACAVSPRFANLHVCCSTEDWSAKRQTQFAAIAIPLNEGTFIAFRGTDNTLVGWRENFNMAFQVPVPAQTAAVEYFEDVSSKLPGPFYLSGHSKGGNLAVYAVMMCDGLVRDRVVKCYALDCPGFDKAATDNPAWAGAYELVERTVTQDSLVGALFGRQEPQPRVIRSNRKSAFQHDPFSWEIEGEDFAEVLAMSYDAYKLNKRVNAWIDETPDEEAEAFIGTLFELIESTGEVTLTGALDSLSDGSLSLMLQRLEGLPAKQKLQFIEQLKELAATLLIGPAPTNPVTPEERIDDATDKVDDATAKFNDSLSKLDKYLS